MPRASSRKTNSLISGFLFGQEIVSFMSLFVMREVHLLLLLLLLMLFNFAAVVLI